MGARSDHSAKILAVLDREVSLRVLSEWCHSTRQFPVSTLTTLLPLLLLFLDSRSEDQHCCSLLSLLSVGQFQIASFSLLKRSNGTV